MFGRGRSVGARGSCGSVDCARAPRRLLLLPPLPPPLPQPPLLFLRRPRQKHRNNRTSLCAHRVDDTTPAALRYPLRAHGPPHAVHVVHGRSTTTGHLGRWYCWYCRWRCCARDRSRDAHRRDTRLRTRPTRPSTSISRVVRAPALRRLCLRRAGGYALALSTARRPQMF